MTNMNSPYILKVAFLGGMYAGKSWCGSALHNARAFPIAAPLKWLWKKLGSSGVTSPGTAGKHNPVVREWLQRVGMWGRGESPNLFYKDLTELLRFAKQVHKLPPGGPYNTVWENFGLSRDFWISSLLEYLRAMPESELDNVDYLVVDDVRFINEALRLAREGFLLVFVAAHEVVRQRRAANLGLPLSAFSELKNSVSEAFANQVWNDNTAYSGLIDYCVWNCDAEEGDFWPKPSGYLAVSELLAALKSRRADQIYSKQTAPSPAGAV